MSSSVFDRIERAIRFIEARFTDQPNLETIAEQAGLSPAHFQRLFTDWVGTSPKKFLQYVSLERAKTLLERDRISLERASSKIGLSGSGRLHDLFITIEGMTPGEYKQGGAPLEISYAFAETPFGRVIVASTTKGVCHLSFAESDDKGVAELQSCFPRARFMARTDALQESALSIFRQDWTDLPLIKLHLKGTAFQLRVWQALLTIPAGALTTYGSIAGHIHHPSAYRAVGTAIGKNPVSFLIPCHRVIQSSGTFGQYRWGPTRKIAMIGWEGAKTNEGSTATKRT